MVETEIFWLVMKHVIEIVMYSAISQVQNEQQISTNCHHQSFISISDWEKLYKATTLRKRLTIICNTLWIYFATEVKQVLIKLLHEASE
ncbi:MAG: hypothetical protein H6767_03530 [Candidatus Peribacteria bacterium]|nr:MAG: hypothetical protein H6767_03530 [Candidatus Peribacteria bacterium]